MTSPARYWVDGVQLVNVGGELCEACELRPAVGRSVGGNAICKRCAGWAAREAEELAAELAEAKARRADTVAEIRARISVVDDRQSQAERAVARHASRAKQYARQRAQAAARTHFKCGHPITPENTYLSKAANRTPFRYCRACACARSRRREQAS
jgi:cell pole-organizing protein PopZ